MTPYYSNARKVGIAFLKITFHISISSLFCLSPSASCDVFKNHPSSWSQTLCYCYVCSLGICISPSINDWNTPLIWFKLLEQWDAFLTQAIFCFDTEKLCIEWLEGEHLTWMMRKHMPWREKLCWLGATANLPRKQPATIVTTASKTYPEIIQPCLNLE